MNLIHRAVSRELANELREQMALRYNWKLSTRLYAFDFTFGTSKQIVVSARVELNGTLQIEILPNKAYNLGNLAFPNIFTKASALILTELQHHVLPFLSNSLSTLAAIDLLIAKAHQCIQCCKGVHEKEVIRDWLDYADEQLHGDSRDDLRQQRWRLMILAMRCFDSNLTSREFACLYHKQFADTCLEIALTRRLSMSYESAPQGVLCERLKSEAKTQFDWYFEFADLETLLMADHLV